MMISKRVRHHIVIYQWVKCY